MGLFGKLKNILFEDDDEVDEMPVYTKEEIAEEEPAPAEEVKVEPVTQRVGTVAEPTRFRNVKRDLDISFDEDEDVLGEIPGAFENTVPKEEPKKEEPVVIPEEPKKEERSIFPSFDEAEFERLNAHILNNENKSMQREEARRAEVNSDNNAARQANNHFSATNVKETRDPDRYKINTGTIVNGKKPFVPSPVISPVYGILDKNYTKDDIVDRKGGLKRDRTIKPPVKLKTVGEAEEEVEAPEVSLEAVRKKAYGDEIELPRVEEPKKEEVKETKPSEEVYKELPEVVEEEQPPVKEEVKTPEVKSIEDQIEEEKFEVDEKVLEVKEEEPVPEVEAEKVEKKKPKVMDDLEKTSTLKILDDIEKELNSIKPISKEAEAEEDADIKEHEVTMDDTLENDLFNLIDSMYEEGDEEDD